MNDVFYTEGGNGISKKKNEVGSQCAVRKVNKMRIHSLCALEVTGD